MNSSAVQAENLASERHELLHTRTAWVDASPQFEVFDPVVVLDPVLVVDGFSGAKRPAKVFGHDNTVNELSLSMSVHVLPDVAFGVVIGLACTDELLRGAPSLEATPMNPAHAVACDVVVAALNTARCPSSLRHLCAVVIVNQ